MREERYIETHIGEYLEEEFLKPFNLSQSALAIALHVPSTRINKIINGSCRITVDTDLRLCKFFGMSSGFFLGVQADLERMNVQPKIQKDLNTIIPYERRENDYAKM